jgi:hypothetical protein
MPINIFEKGFKVTKFIGMMVLKLGGQGHKASKLGIQKLTNLKKLALYEVVGYISLIYHMYISRKREEILEKTFLTFANKIPHFMESKNLSQLLIRLKIELSSILNSEDISVLITKPRDTSLYGLNSNYGIKDFKDDSALELNRYSSPRGLTLEVMTKNRIFYSDSPHKEALFIP